MRIRIGSFESGRVTIVARSAVYRMSTIIMSNIKKKTIRGTNYYRHRKT